MPQRRQLQGAGAFGFGTLIASLASLISFQIYRKADGAKAGRFMLVFSALNFALLAILLIGAYLIPTT